RPRRLVESDHVAVRLEPEATQVIGRRESRLPGADDGNVDLDHHLDRHAGGAGDMHGQRNDPYLRRCAGVARRPTRHVMPGHYGCRRGTATVKPGRIPGFTMIGQDAGEVMAVVRTAMLARLPFTTLLDAILAH